ncbi:nucleotidyl transferase AbiEii/AbiGii toxin family protein [Roseateles sp. BYS78W]|uniref:Nucleotidyl transferase AbiEii/AbiGii toxin family protein n=1 Tax=Pelomonas candidula TaxID=3299025 RepID=A0ABW7H8L2_9BURK
MTDDYIATVRLLLDIAQTVFQSGLFAMKGGTALNLFVQDMPRLSVDIDVVFIDHAPDREAALAAIGVELRNIQQTLQSRGLDVHLPANAKGDEVRLSVRSADVQVKVEVNFVFRGTVMPVQAQALASSAQDLFTTEVTLPVLAAPELYGSKLVAAMDRQHPRDIFDVMHMLQRFGWASEVVDCFVAYLAGHNRPVHEVLFGPAKSLEPAFTNEFVGMTREPVSLEALTQTQAQLRHELPRQLSADHRAFLLSLVRGEPTWSLMRFEQLQALPAIRWKLQNLGTLKRRDPGRFEEQERLLAEGFAGL